MEIYELRVRTLQILESLRKTGTAGPAGAGRGVGKTTALLLRAKELHDSPHRRGAVFVLSSDRQLGYLQLIWASLFGPGLDVRFHSALIDVLGYRDAYVLIDEPYLLKKSREAWYDFHGLCNRFNVTVESVGAWVGANDA